MYAFPLGTLVFCSRDCSYSTFMWLSLLLFDGDIQVHDLATDDDKAMYKQRHALMCTWCQVLSQISPLLGATMHCSCRRMHIWPGMGYEYEWSRVETKIWAPTISYCRSFHISFPLNSSTHEDDLLAIFLCIRFTAGMY